MEYNIRKGVINQSKHLTSSPVYENFSDIFKKLLVKYKIPFRDITCPELFNVSTVRFNNITNKLEILVISTIPYLLSTFSPITKHIF